MFRAPPFANLLDLLEQIGLLYSSRGGACVSRLLGEGFRSLLLEMIEKNEFGSTYDYLEFRGTVEGTTAYFIALRAS